MAWLKGGPFYELSFLFLNEDNRSNQLHGIIETLSRDVDFRFAASSSTVRDEIAAFVLGIEQDGITRRSVGFNARIEIKGDRKSRVFIDELSAELTKVDVCFYGSVHDAPEWQQLGLREEHKKPFLGLFHVIKAALNPILGTTAYGEDCSALFDIDEGFPNANFTVYNLSVSNISQLLSTNPSGFEYCCIGTNKLGNVEEIILMN